MFTKSQDSTKTEFSNALVPGKKSHLKQGGQIVHSSFHTEILATLLAYLQIFASLVKKKKFNIADHYRLSLIG